LQARTNPNTLRHYIFTLPSSLSFPPSLPSSLPPYLQLEKAEGHGSKGVGVHKPLPPGLDEGGEEAPVVILGSVHVFFALIGKEGMREGGKVRMKENIW
jgi:hypothetical protein